MPRHIACDAAEADGAWVLSPGPDPLAWFAVNAPPSLRTCGPPQSAPAECPEIESLDVPQELVALQHFQQLAPVQPVARLLRAGEISPTFSHSRSVDGLTPRMRDVSPTVSKPSRGARARSVPCALFATSLRLLYGRRDI